MNKADLNRLLGLDESVLNVIDLAEQKSGKPIEFRFDKSLQTPVVVKMARQRMNWHLLRINSSYEDVAGYLVANKTLNILRTFEVEPGLRVVPAVTPITRATAMAALSRYLERKNFPQHIINFWIDGLINQLTNLPVQIQIERWIYHHLPAIHNQQKDYLLKDIEQSIAGLSDRIRQLTPSPIYTSGNAMTYAWATGIESIIGQSFDTVYRKHLEIVREGKHLLGIVDRINGQDHIDDVRVINEWAQRLRLEKWFAWQNFEDMPENYYQDIMV